MINKSMTTIILKKYLKLEVVYIFFGSKFQYKMNNFILSLQNGVRKIIMNRPQKKNAMNKPMYEGLTNILNDDAENDEIVVTILTGAGEYYSSGNDITSALQEGASLDLPKNLIQAFIDYPKILIAVVNGPAIGIAATTVALCDIVYASDKAYFDTPFVNLGLCAEGASSYTFPRILGRSKASEVLLLNKKLSAQEAMNFGLVSEVIPHKNLDNFIQSLYVYGELPVNIVKTNKGLFMKAMKDVLTDCNRREVDTLKTCIESEEFGQAIMRFLNRKSKL